MDTDMQNTQNIEIEIAGIKKDLTYLIEKVDDIRKSQSVDYVKREEFIIVRNLVFGFTSLLLISVVGAIVALVINKPIH